MLTSKIRNRIHKPSPFEGEGRGEGDCPKKTLILLAKIMRKHPTDAENLLWQYLHAKKLGGFKFRRQHPIGKYIVDFICLKKKLAIELDGGQHAKKRVASEDRTRDEWMKSQGFKILRIWNHEVLQNLEGVLEIIADECKSPSPFSPPIKGGEL